MRTRRGGAAIEFALTAPILFGIFGAVVDLSYFLSQFHLVERAARDGARVGSITIEGSSPTGAEIEAAAVAQAQSMLAAGEVDCSEGCTTTASWDIDPIDGYYYVTVNVGVPFKPLTGLLPFLEAYGMNAEFEMLTQQQ